MVEMQRKALERLWKDTCSVYVKESAVQNGLTGFQERLLYEAVPCRLSFETLAAAGDGNTARVSQAVKLFLGKEYKIPAGSRIEVMRDGKRFRYRRSGEPGVFGVHQEIFLELEKEKA